MTNRKLYFAKYIAVEGEPEEGDIVKTMGEKITIFKDGMRKKAYQKFKLFLCTYLLKIGDIAKECLIDKNLEKIHHFDSILPIGEISDKAIWVKEGDEWEEEDMGSLYHGRLQPIPIYKGDTKSTLLGSNRQVQAIASREIPDRYIILVKCPSCNTFH